MLRKKLGVIYRNAVPEKIQPRLDCMRAIPSWRKASVIFIHVPKVAGVSISTSLYGKTLGHIMASDIQKYYPGEFSELFKFAFIRDPYERFLSAVKYVDCNYQRLAGSPGLPNEKRLFSCPSLLMNEWLKYQDLEKVNNVFRPQSKYILGSDGEILVDYLGDYSRMEEGMAVVAQRLGHPIKLEKLNSSGPLSRKKDEHLIEDVLKVYRNDCELMAQFRGT